MSIARHHSEWLSLVEVSGPFLSIPVLMRVFPQGLENHDPDKFRTLRLAYEEWEDNNEAGHRTNPALHGAWVKFVMTTILGLPDEAILEQQAIPQTLQANVPEHGEFLRPSLVVAEPGTPTPRLLVQTYPANQDLDKPVTGKSWKASPGTRMMELCHATGVRLGLVTNGERWMLVDAPKNETTGLASWYANLWLEEPITLRAFTSLLGGERFFNVAAADTLEALLKESAGNQQEVTDQLGYQVRRAVEVLIQSLDRADQDHDRSLLASIPEPVLYEAALTVMMRLVFLFSAEERGLLLLNDELYARNYAVSTLREQLRKTADDHGEEILERRHDAWCRLLSTFRAVYGGVKHDRMTLPAYGGHLFDPDRFPFLEGRKSGTMWKNCEADPLPVNNRTVLHLLEALQMLEVRMPGGEKAARRVSFRALDIEQIGHVYEGMLDHTAKRASEPMLGLVGTRDKEPEVAISRLEKLAADSDGKLAEFLRDETGKSANAIKKALTTQIDLTNANRFQAVCGNNKDLIKRLAPFAGLVRDDTFGYPVVITKGSVFVTAGTDRRSSGTHYTPKSLTEPVVQYALEPLVYIGPAEGKPKEEWRLRTPKDLLELKVCDMACGSGAFIVQGCRYLSERLVEAWEIAERNYPSPNPGKLPFPTIMAEGKPSSGAPGETLIPKDADERMAYAKRLVAQRCLYGVDINPLAVEMAKLSLWLLTMAKDKPFTFLDHAIRCGDSLLGIHDLKQLKTFSLDGTGQQYVLGEVPLEKLVDEAVQLRLKIESMPGNTVEDVEAQAQIMANCEQRLEFLKCSADMLIAAELRGGSARERLGHRDHAAVQIGHYLKNGNPAEFQAAANRALRRRSFHWPLEFPEIVAKRGGFDAILGNPPFMGGSKLATTCGVEYRDYLVQHIAGGVRGERGQADLCAYMFRRAEAILAPESCCGLLATNTIAQGDSRQVGLDELTDHGMSVIRAIPSQKWPGVASLEIAAVWLRKGEWKGVRVLDDGPVPYITSYLAAEGRVQGQPYRLVHNTGKSFEGSRVEGTGFVLDEETVKCLISDDPRNASVIYRYLRGEDFTSRPDMSPGCWVINFLNWPLDRNSAPDGYAGPVASDYPDCLSILEKDVKPQRLELPPKNAMNISAAAKWWQYRELRPTLHEAIQGMDRVLFHPFGPTKYVCFGFVPCGCIFAAPNNVFALDGWSDFAILQSTHHIAWAWSYGSTLETRLRYTRSSCFETFPFPTTFNSLAQVGELYHRTRSKLMLDRKLGLTTVYNLVNDAQETTIGVKRLRELHVAMDSAVATAYGWTDFDLNHAFHPTKQGTRFTISETARREVLARLLKLNHGRYAEEVAQGLHDKKKAKSKKTEVATAAGGSPLFDTREES